MAVRTLPAAGQADGAAAGDGQPAVHEADAAGRRDAAWSLP